jgi:hypothetical protein
MRSSSAPLETLRRGNDSVGLLRAIAEVGFEPMIVGGAMIGPQSNAVQQELGPLLNGVVNYESRDGSLTPPGPGVAILWIARRRPRRTTG